MTDSSNEAAQDENMAQASAVQVAYADELMRKPHVVGLAVGYAQVDGQPTDEIALVVLVDKKVPEDELAQSDMIPNELDGVRVDVQEVGEIQAF